jgi:hypothetical protein
VSQFRFSSRKKVENEPCQEQRQRAAHIPAEKHIPVAPTVDLIEASAILRPPHRFHLVSFRSEFDEGGASSPASAGNSCCSRVCSSKWCIIWRAKSDAEQSGKIAINAASNCLRFCTE